VQYCYFNTSNANTCGGCNRRRRGAPRDEDEKHRKTKTRNAEKNRGKQSLLKKCSGEGRTRSTQASAKSTAAATARLLVSGANAMHGTLRVFRPEYRTRKKREREEVAQRSSPTNHNNIFTKPSTLDPCAAKHCVVVKRLGPQQERSDSDSDSNSNNHHHHHHHHHNKNNDNRFKEWKTMEFNRHVAHLQIHKLGK